MPVVGFSVVAYICPRLANNLRWSPPPLGSVKVNVDASWRCFDAQGHVGAMIHDSSSVLLAIRRRAIQARNVLLAEALGILEGSVLFRLMGFAKVIVESDSMDIISCLNGCFENAGWEVFPTFCKIQQIGAAFMNCVWS